MKLLFLLHKLFMDSLIYKLFENNTNTQEPRAGEEGTTR